jgi:hypothetical protein
MLRDTLLGLIEPMPASAGANHSRTGCPRYVSTHRTIDPDALKIPAPIGAEPTLTENASSPFHAEPGHDIDLSATNLHQMHYPVILVFPELSPRLG